MVDGDFSEVASLSRHARNLSTVGIFRLTKAVGPTSTLGVWCNSQT